MNCPRCIEPLIPGLAEHQGVFRCQRCEGLWMDVDQLEELYRQAFEPSAETCTAEIYQGPAVEAFLCPGCGKPTLQEALIGEFAFVLCDPCDGAWLAHREDLSNARDGKDGLHALLRKHVLLIPGFGGG